MTQRTFKVGNLQHSGLEIYVFDPFFDEPDDDDYSFPGTFDFETSALTVSEGCEAQAAARLTDAANSADDDKDRQLCEALGNLALRVARSAAKP